MPGVVRQIHELSAADLPSVGGKAANLGELRRGGFVVPDGFVLTTEAYEDAARAAGVDPSAPSTAAERLRSVPVPEAIARQIRDAYRTLGEGRVAVRSSATAEDLPGASFAGQQDTFLGVEGDQQLLDAIRRCWASLWNERAVAYRRANGIDDATVALAVVIQRQVDASAAGVLFTADPVTGRRRRAAIDAIAGLGEKLVSGAVDPDHYLVGTATGEIVERRPAGESPVLSDEELRALAEMGARVERHFGSPQDIEFAFDRDRRLWLVQSRPITTLYPLPPDVPDPARELRIYLSANVFQGYLEPLTPMGIQFFQLLGTGLWTAFGARVADRYRGPPMVAVAGMRIYLDVTRILADPIGRRLLVGLLGFGESRSSAALARLAGDPRMPRGTGSRIGSIRRIFGGLGRVGVLQAAVRAMLDPGSTRARYVRELDALARIDVPVSGGAPDAVEGMILGAPRLLPRLLGLIAPAMLSLGLARVLLRGIAREDEVQTITRGAPDNPTTEMDLALWALAREMRGDPDSIRALGDRAPSDLAAAYHARALPPRLQTGLATFLERYGFRSIGEIDLGVPRWSEDPTHILGALANYVRLRDDALAPDAQFAKGAREADAMVAALLERVRGPRRLVLRALLRRIRILIGSREAPKFHIIRLLVTPARMLLKDVGAELAARGRIAAADDIFFLTLPEARRAADGDDLRATVATRRAEFAREKARRHIPRVLLSDGTDVEAALAAPAGDGIRGSPASPGVVTGTARVILSPQGARLEPGEILVAPSTDPGWTPLFLTAGALVMEMGGMMSHGAVVAREYGIPAVVGVTGATEKISNGQRLTVDGSAGTVVIED